MVQDCDVSCGGTVQEAYPAGSQGSGTDTIVIMDTACQGGQLACTAENIPRRVNNSFYCLGGPTPTPTPAPTPTPTPEPTPTLEPTPPGGGCACYDIVGCYQCAGYDGCQCTAFNEHSPVLIDVNGDGYRLTNRTGGVLFDLDVRGRRGETAWTAAGSDDAFLVLDRNNNGTIDDGTELFGDSTPQPPSSEPNGFIALAEYDKPANGGNYDGKISVADSAYSALRLWRDTNHDGLSTESELHALSALSVAVIELDYRASRRRDQYGNEFRYRAEVLDARGAHVGRWAWDVFFNNAP